jgi:UDP-N-acetylmuramoyl-tripeptide--D-alanyl-D-alanine ligase
MIPLIILVPFIIVRWFRWLAIIQQKEYRLDRLSAYVKSVEGKRELLRVIPKFGDFTRKGFKRPKLTARITLVLIISSIPIVYLLWLISVVDIITAFTLGVLGYLCLPVLAFLSATPSYLMSETMTVFALRRAKMLISKFHPKIIGITGSYGKTSTKLLLAHILRKRYGVFTTPKSFNQRYSVAKSIINSYEGQELVVLEYAAYKTNEIKELANYIKPTLVVITGLTNQHLSTFGSVNNIIKAKSELVTALENKSEVFYNGQDAEALKIAEAGGATRPINYTTVENIKASLSNEGNLLLEWKSHKLKTKLVGAHYLQAVEAVITICLHLGLSEREIVAGLTDFEPGENFVKTRVLERGALLLDDGRTANRMGFMAAVDLLKTLRATNKKSNSMMIFAGIIDLGDESVNTHLELANRAKEVVDEVLYVGVDGLREFKDVFREQLTTDNEEIIEKLRGANQDTIILLEGYIPKKYETYL